MFSKTVLLIVLVVTLAMKLEAQFPHSDPYKWRSNSGNRVEGYGGGNSRFGSVDIAAQRQINNRWDARGKVGVSYFPGGNQKRADIGAGYNVNRNLNIGGSVGRSSGGEKRAGVQLNYKFGK